jgi:uncharacterized membrane protein
MGEVPSEIALQASRSLAEQERANLRHFDVFIETTTQMLATPRLQERLLLALEAIVHSLGCEQAAIAIINERDAELRVRAALGFAATLLASCLTIEARAQDASPWQRDAHSAVRLLAGSRSGAVSRPCSM